MVRSLASNLGVEVKNPKWTSYGALEMDFFTQSRGDFELCREVLSPLCEIEFVKDLNVAPPHMDDSEIVQEARSLFNAERYWEGHEVLEGMWRNLKGEDKSYVQGIILVCAAYVHHQKGENDVATGVLRRAVKQLVYDKVDYKGIDTAELRRKVEAILQTGVFAPFTI
jgi:hypothetical protein